MRWDAYLEDGKGDLRVRAARSAGSCCCTAAAWCRSSSAAPSWRRDRRCRTSGPAPNTYGHRFLTTSGRAGRAIKVKTFDDYQARLLENFVILDRARARVRRSAASSRRTRASWADGSAASSRRSRRCCRKCRTSSSIPSVVAGHFPVEFLQLPEEVLTTTMIHHQHYFPVVDDEGKLKPAFLAVTNMQAEKPEIIARNSERVLTARLRDARFFWDEDRKAPLESRIERLVDDPVSQEARQLQEKAERVAALAAWIADEALQQPDAAAHAERAGRLCKADLATDMVRELTELQGTMGGIYAREEGLPEEVWKAIYYHYLPVGVEADAPPSRQQLGAAAVTWAAVSLADKLDSVVGMFAAGERPTGSRDPLGLRRQAQGAVKILADLPELTGLDASASRSGRCSSRRRSRSAATASRRRPLLSFMARSPGVPARAARLRRPQRARGDARRDRATSSPLEARRKLEALAQMTGSAALLGVATLLKRVKNITKGVRGAAACRRRRGVLTEPAEQALLAAAATPARRASAPPRRAATIARPSPASRRCSRRWRSSSTTCW